MRVKLTDRASPPVRVATAPSVAAGRALLQQRIKAAIVRAASR
jgi:hypothetical protein